LSIVSKHNKTPENRIGQKMLARIVVEMIHGKQKAELSEKISQFLFTDADKLELLK
jgi:tyrosyl-tRNA synthetase